MTIWALLLRILILIAMYLAGFATRDVVPDQPWYPGKYLHQLFLG